MVQEPLLSIENPIGKHTLKLGDARDLSFLEDESIHLIVTSPPYWNLKEYETEAGQMGDIEDYEAFLVELNKVWVECERVLVKGGRLVVVVGDVAIARKNKDYGRHLVFPLHADIQVQCRKIGLDNLNPIIWHKIANVNREGGGGGFLGKPYEPNAIIQSDIEYILMQRKPGGYRSPTEKQRDLSRFEDKAEFKEYFQQIWSIGGASCKDHPAPYPLEISNRLIKMFSFHGDTVLDPFSGSGTTVMSAAINNRLGIGVEISQKYLYESKTRFVDMFGTTQALR